MKNSNIKFQPKSLYRDISDINLSLLLTNDIDNSTWKKRIKNIFCWHSWLYWKYGDATKIHRICNKCHKKQKNSEVISKGIDRWIKDSKIIINPTPKIIR